jgi:hypothetical protein
MGRLQSLFTLGVLCALWSCSSPAPAPTGSSRGAADQCDEHRNNHYDALYRAKYFSSSSAVYERPIPEAVIALRCMSVEADAAPRLKDLAMRGSVAGQLYAAVGLRAVDKAEFEIRIAPLLSNHTKIPILGGDVYMEHEVALFAAAIVDGQLVTDFLPNLKHMLPELSVPPPTLTTDPEP